MDLCFYLRFQFFLVACNQSVEYTIYFDSNGGSEVSSIKTGGNSTVALPANSTKEGFEFDNWQDKFYLLPISYIIHERNIDIDSMILKYLMISA